MDRKTWSPELGVGPRPADGAAFFGPGLTPHDVLVAVADDELIASIAFGPPLPLLTGRHQLQVKGLAVDPHRRREGAGSALLEELVERARKNGIRRLVLRVLATNKPARALYDKLGFEVEGILREAFRIDGRYVDDVLMGLPLSE